MFALGAIDKQCNLESPIGPLFLEFPVDPKIAGMIINATKLGCLDEILTAAALLHVDSIFLGARGKKHGQKRFAVAEGDIFTCINGTSY